MTFKQFLIDDGACQDAIDWVGDKTIQEAWQTCERADWMLWLADKLKLDRKQIVLATCACARTALKYTKDKRVLACIETTEAWCSGEATIEEVRAAADAAYAAADAAYAAADAAADAAARAADCAAYAAYAATRAADAADAAADAAADYTATHKEMCNIVRNYLTIKETTHDI